MYKEDLDNIINIYNNEHTISHSVPDPIRYVQMIAKENNWGKEEVLKNFPQVKFAVTRFVVSMFSLTEDKFFNW